VRDDLDPPPPNVVLAAGIDLHADDPALLDSGRRVCVAERKAGGRCKSPAVVGLLLCGVHSGRCDPAAGGRAAAEKRNGLRLAAEDRVAERMLGVRSALSAQLQRRADDVVAVVDNILDRARDGDHKAQLALLPYLDQALGKPTERIEQASGAETLDRMATEDLAARVAQARRERLRLASDETA